jgi:IMP dehydrogenase/GMP reductase
MEEKLDFKDITIVPAISSDIETRSIIQSTYPKQNLDGNWINISPIIVSPMDTVVDEKNYKLFVEKGMLTCLPRGVNVNLEESEKDFVFFSYGKDEFQKLMNKNYNFPKKVLIDVANGNMSSIVNLVKNFKSIYKSHEIMIGNIANPETYRLLSLAGADYVRVGIGGGAGCLTSEMTSIHYPMASLIMETNHIKCDLIKQNYNAAKIVGDGGFRDYSDIIKGLALGADYIMVGSSLNKCIESSGDSYFHGIKVSNRLSKFLFSKEFNVTKKFRGMSTKEVQKKWGKTTFRASEGVIRFRKVEYTLDGWIRNFDDYLKSCMSYTGILKLKDFIGEPEWVRISNNAYKRFNK